MRKKCLFHLALFLFALVAFVPAAQADDRIVTGTVSGTQTISSDEGIVFNAATIVTGAVITADSTFDLHIKPGTRIAAGARLTVSMRDNDGLSNHCEMYYFNHLNWGPGDDPDIDILTNLDECTLGTDPNYTDKDNDDDGLEDWWEIKYFGLKDLAQLQANGPDDDYDDDGITNGIEYRLRLDPTTSQGKQPGIFYEYDKLGRIKKIERIPAR